MGGIRLRAVKHMGVGPLSFLLKAVTGRPDVAPIQLVRYASSHAVMSSGVADSSLLQQSKPAVIRGGAANWLARERWTSQYLARYDTVVPIEVGEHYLHPDHRSGVPIKFSDFVQQLGLQTTDASQLQGSESATTSSTERQAPMYLAQSDLFEHIPSLAADIGEPANWQAWVPAASRTAARRNAWIGPAGVWSPLHRDPYHNLYCQVRGRKLFRLYAPELEHALHPFADVRRRNSSQVINPTCPDLQRFPHFPSLPYTEAVLEPGDVLYMPPRWWHYVQSLTASIAISFWFTLPPEAGAAAGATKLPPLNLPPPKSRRSESSGVGMPHIDALR